MRAPILSEKKEYCRLFINHQGKFVHSPELQVDIQCKVRSVYACIGLMNDWHCTLRLSRSGEREKTKTIFIPSKRVAGILSQSCTMHFSVRRQNERAREERVNALSPSSLVLASHTDTGSFFFLLSAKKRL